MKATILKINFLILLTLSGIPNFALGSDDSSSESGIVGEHASEDGKIEEDNSEFTMVIVVKDPATGETRYLHWIDGRYVDVQFEYSRMEKEKASFGQSQPKLSNRSSLLSTFLSVLIPLVSFATVVIPLVSHSGFSGYFGGGASPYDFNNPAFKAAADAYLQYSEIL